MVYKYVQSKIGPYRVEDFRANFLDFGIDFEELRDGVGMYSTAIVERDDGTVLNISIDMIKFVKE